MSVPDELSVAGFDDISLAQQIYPALTTVRQPLGAMAERAGRLLLGGAVEDPDNHVVAAELVIRESTGPAPVTH